jgi:hypothetical protein
MYGAVHAIDPRKRSDERALRAHGSARKPGERAGYEVPEPPGT